jgi:hypothetical protein
VRESNVPKIGCEVARFLVAERKADPAHEVATAIPLVTA